MNRISQPFKVCINIGIWDAMGRNLGREALSTAIASLKSSDTGFNIEGASWTNNLSWVEGYENILEPMNQLSAQFHMRFDLRSF